MTIDSLNTIDANVYQYQQMHFKYYKMNIKITPTYFAVNTPPADSLELC